MKITLVSHASLLVETSGVRILSDPWYDGRIYESDMTRGLTIWRLNDPAVDTYLRTGHLNPQTQEFSIDR